MIDQDILRAHTLPAAFYRDRHPFTNFKESLFRDAWHYLHADTQAWNSHNAFPVTILPGYLDEPVLLTKDRKHEVRCMSNVCTHRGNLLLQTPAQLPLLRCRYHGRCFGLDGVCRSQTGFEDVLDFPGPKDHLTSIDLKTIGVLHFGRIRKNVAFDSVFQPMLDRLSWFPFRDLIFDNTRSHDYSVKAHWALYVDNYLEGYHVPFIHPALSAALDTKKYEYQLYPGSTLQLGRASEKEQTVFNFPSSAVDASERIYAYYWWIFPNLMFNVYPWGLSLNSVEPISLTETRVRFFTFVLKDEMPPDFSAIHQVEMEDEAIVEQVQHGISSSFYKEGRYSPAHETAVHHFHLQLSHYLDAMNDK